MYRIAICDDNEIFLNSLRVLVTRELERHHVQAEILAYSETEPLLQDLAANPSDLLLLDIEMPHLSGMKAAEKIRSFDKKLLIVFVTGHDNLVYKAFPYTPFRFIRKSHLEEELPEALSAAMEKIAFLEMKWCFETAGGELFLSLNDVLYFEALGHIVVCHATVGMHRIKEPLSFLEQTLAVFGYIRTHKSFLVNSLYIFSINKSDVTLTTDNIRIPLSKHRVEEVKSNLLNFGRRL